MTEVYHKPLPGLTPTMRRFNWRTHKLLIRHETDDKMTVHIHEKGNHETFHIARFPKQFGANPQALWHHRDFRRLQFLDIEPELLTKHRYPKVPKGTRP